MMVDIWLKFVSELVVNQNVSRENWLPITIQGYSLALKQKMVYLNSLYNIIHAAGSVCEKQLEALVSEWVEIDRLLPVVSVREIHSRNW